MDDVALAKAGGAMTFYVSYNEDMAASEVVEADSATTAADLVANGAVASMPRAFDGDDLYVREEGADDVIRFSCESVNRIDVHRETTP